MSDSAWLRRHRFLLALLLTGGLTGTALFFIASRFLPQDPRPRVFRAIRPVPKLVITGRWCFGSEIVVPGGVSEVGIAAPGLAGTQAFVTRSGEVRFISLGEIVPFERYACVSPELVADVFGDLDRHRTRLVRDTPFLFRITGGSNLAEELRGTKRFIRTPGLSAVVERLKGVDAEVAPRRPTTCEDRPCWASLSRRYEDDRRHFPDRGPMFYLDRTGQYMYDTWRGRVTPESAIEALEWLGAEERDGERITTSDELIRRFQGACIDDEWRVIEDATSQLWARRMFELVSNATLGADLAAR